MIDTIVLRLHGLKKYKTVLKRLDLLNIKGYSTELAKVSQKDIANLRKQGITAPSEQMQLLKKHRTGEYIVRTKVAKQISASSHYEFAYRIEYTRDFLELNFSVPKYVYGSNVLMFLDHIYNRHFTYHLCSELDFNIKRAYPKLRSFLRELFKMEFLGVEIDPRDVEVNRIDVCFNQIFPNKGDALRFLEYQKRKVKKHSRNGEDGYKEYNTSLMYSTKLYSAKIYHKGTEYAVNDQKEHKKYNKEKGTRYFKTDEYQALADKMLRYELTMRTGMLNYLHKAHIFRKDCPSWKLYFKVYQEVEAKNQRRERIAKKIGILPEEQKEAYREAHPYEKVSREERYIHKRVTKLITKRTLFTFEVDEKDAIYNQQVCNYDSDRARFCPELVELCLEKLVAFMKEYQMKELPEESKIVAAIDEYNLRHTKKLPKGEMVSYYHHLLKCGSFKDASKFLCNDRSTMYRYKQRFKKVGITDNNLIPLTSNGIPGAPLDLRAYHSHHQFNRHFLDKKGYLEMF